jgi:hypothetical protein
VNAGYGNELLLQIASVRRLLVVRGNSFASKRCNSVKNRFIRCKWRVTSRFFPLAICANADICVIDCKLNGAIPVMTFVALCTLHGIHRYTAARLLRTVVQISKKKLHAEAG